MPSTPRKRTLADLTKSLETQCEITRGVAELAESDPDAARVFVAALAEIVGLGSDKRAVHAVSGNGHSKAKLTHFDRMVSVFLDNGNTAMTKAQLAAAAGITESGVHSTLYGSPKPKKDSFALSVNPSGAREKIVKLTPEALSEAKKAQEANG